jgi:hypothetical protein
MRLKSQLIVRAHPRPVRQWIVMAEPTLERLFMAITRPAISWQFNSLNSLLCRAVFRLRSRIFFPITLSGFSVIERTSVIFSDIIRIDNGGCPAAGKQTF